MTLPVGRKYLTVISRCDMKNEIIGHTSDYTVHSSTYRLAVFQIGCERRDLVLRTKQVVKAIKQQEGKKEKIENSSSMWNLAT